MTNQLTPCLPKNFHELKKGDVFAAAMRNAGGSIVDLPLLLVAENDYSPYSGLTAYVVNGAWELEFDAKGSSTAPTVDVWNAEHKRESRRLDHLIGYTVVFTGPWPSRIANGVRNYEDGPSSTAIYNEALDFAKLVMSGLTEDIASGIPETVARDRRIADIMANSPTAEYFIPPHPTPEHPEASMAVYEFGDGTVVRIPCLWADNGEILEGEDIATRVFASGEFRVCDFGVADEYVYRLADPAVRKELRFLEQTGTVYTNPVRPASEAMTPTKPGIEVAQGLATWISSVATDDQLDAPVPALGGRSGRELLKVLQTPAAEAAGLTPDSERLNFLHQKLEHDGYGYWLPDLCVRQGGNADTPLSAGEFRRALDLLCARAEVGSPADYADRWELGFRRIVAALAGNKTEFEIDDIVKQVIGMAERLSLANSAAVDDYDARAELGCEVKLPAEVVQAVALATEPDTPAPARRPNRP
jgi:hypothetical protein